MASKTKVTVTTEDGTSYTYKGFDVGFSLDPNNILIVHEPSPTKKAAPDVRRTIALFKTWASAEHENIG